MRCSTTFVFKFLNENESMNMTECYFSKNVFIHISEFVCLYVTYAEHRRETQLE